MKPEVFDTSVICKSKNCLHGTHRHLGLGCSTHQFCVTSRPDANEGQHVEMQEKKALVMEAEELAHFHNIKRYPINISLKMLFLPT